MIALNKINYDDVIFIDIETVRAVDKLEEGSPLHDSWAYKLRYSRESDKFEDKSELELFADKAALYAEFAKIVCITIGRVKDENIVVHTFANDNEETLLQNFSQVMDSFYAKNPNTFLVGHAIKGFDIPFIARRCIINRVNIPVLCDVGHLKPWEVRHLDTMELWKGGGWYGASLINIATAMGLPSPKTDLNGSETSNVYYNEKDGLTRISTYCEQDVICCANVFRTMAGHLPLEGKQSQIKESKDSPITKVATNLPMSAAEKKELRDKYDSLTNEEKEIGEYIINTKLP